MELFLGWVSWPLEETCSVRFVMLCLGLLGCVRFPPCEVGPSCVSSAVHGDEGMGLGLRTGTLAEGVRLGGAEGTELVGDRGDDPVIGEYLTPSRPELCRESDRTRALPDDDLSAAACIAVDCEFDAVRATGSCVANCIPLIDARS